MLYVDPLYSCWVWLLVGVVGCRVFGLVHVGHGHINSSLLGL
jgi:hypothetical protein